jgi:hypothetical protein
LSSRSVADVTMALNAELCDWHVRRPDDFQLISNSFSLACLETAYYTEPALSHLSGFAGALFTRSSI